MFHIYCLIALQSHVNIFKKQKSYSHFKNLDSLKVAKVHDNQRSQRTNILDFMFRRPILCTLYGAVDFLNVLKKGCWWGEGVLLVHSEIYYVPVGDGWEEVLVRNIFHYVPVTPPPPTNSPCSGHLTGPY